MPQADNCLLPSEAGGNDCQSSSHKPPSFDFHGQHELEWSSIKTELHCLTARVIAVEIIGRSAVEDIHGEKRGPVFDTITSDMLADIERIKELLGLGRESGEDTQ